MRMRCALLPPPFLHTAAAAGDGAHRSPAAAAASIYSHPMNTPGQSLSLSGGQRCPAAGRLPAAVSMAWQLAGRLLVAAEPAACRCSSRQPQLVQHPLPGRWLWAAVRGCSRRQPLRRARSVVALRGRCCEFGAKWIVAAAARSPALSEQGWLDRSCCRCALPAAFSTNGWAAVRFQAPAAGSS